jgi:hypothetical protein
MSQSIAPFRCRLERRSFSGVTRAHRLHLRAGAWAWGEGVVVVAADVPLRHLPLHHQLRGHHPLLRHHRPRGRRGPVKAR